MTPAYPAKYLLIIETDYDFDVKFRGEFINDGLLFNTVAELKELEITGPYGSPRTENTKCQDFEQWIQEAIDDLRPCHKGGGSHSFRITNAPKVGSHIKTDINVQEMIETIERRHFRTAYDTGANSNALIVWNSVRDFCGLPYKGIADLPTQCVTHGECHVLGKGCVEDRWNSKCGRFESWLEKKYQSGEGIPAHGVYPNSEIGKWMAERAKKDQQKDDA